MPPTSTGLNVWAADPASWIAGEHPPARLDRVLVGEQRGLHGELVRLRDPRTHPGEEQRQRVERQTRQHHHRREQHARPRHDASAPEAIGQPPHRHGAEHEEGARRRADEHDRPTADVQRVADVRRQRAERGALEVVERDEGGEGHERRLAAPMQRLSQRDVGVPHAGQRLVGDRRTVVDAVPLGLQLEDRPRQLVGALVAHRRSVNGYFACSNALVEGSTRTRRSSDHRPPSAAHRSSRDRARTAGRPGRASRRPP